MIVDHTVIDPPGHPDREELCAQVEGHLCRQEKSGPGNADHRLDPISLQVFGYTLAQETEPLPGNRHKPIPVHIVIASHVGPLLSAHC